VIDLQKKMCVPGICFSKFDSQVTLTSSLDFLGCISAHHTTKSVIQLMD